MQIDRDHFLDRADHLPSAFSGGELQRITLARALMADPVLVLADEPTGNLDAANGAVVLELLQQSAARGRAVVIATHDLRVAEQTTGTVTLEDGVISTLPPREPSH